MIDAFTGSFGKREDEKNANSPFKIREGMSLKLSAKKGIGKKGADALYDNGLINERHIVILRLISEFSVLTSRMIQEAMDSPLVAERFKKNSARKSPYKNDISRLLNRGLISEGVFYMDGKERMKVYYLERGVYEWISEKTRYENRLFETGSPRYRKILTVPDAMRLLSANKFAIKAIGSAFDKLPERRIGYLIGPAAFDLVLKDYDKREICLVSVRKLGLEKIRAAGLLERAMRRSPNLLLIFLTTDQAAAGKLRGYLAELDAYDDERVYYSDDFEVQVSMAFPCVYRFTDTGYLRYGPYS